MPKTKVPTYDYSADITDAVDRAFHNMEIETGYSPEELVRKPVCHEASSLILEHLLINGHKAIHEIRPGGPITDTHSYVVIDNNGREILIDSTWQQFLSPHSLKQDLPRALVGSREEVMEQARSYGVDEELLDLWGDKEIKFTVSPLRTP